MAKATSENAKPQGDKKAPKPKGGDVKMIDHVVTKEDLENNPALVENGVQEGDTIQIPDPNQGKKKSEISDEIRGVFEKHPHVLTIWASEDQKVWYFRAKPGLTAIERNQL